MNTRAMFSALAILIMMAVPTFAGPPATAFTYQGKLTDEGGQPLTGSYSMTFTLFDSAIDGKPVAEPIAPKEIGVSSGLFSVNLDFGPEPFRGQPLWLEIAVGDRSLSPRTQLTAAPMAVHALTVADGSVTSSKLEAGSVTGDKIASGQVVKSINSLKDNVTLAAGAGISIVPSGNTLTLSAAAASSGWSLAGNAGTTPDSQFLGTTDYQPLELRVNNLRALRVEPFLHAVNMIGGWNANSVTMGVYGATISGGGHTAMVNRVTDRYGTVAGGAGNRAGDDSATAYDRDGATVGGGMTNTASGGGATVSGGNQNTASGSYAVVPGGYLNTAQGDCSLASGRRAKALHQGSFVWADSTDADFTSTANNQFLIRAAGNVGINSTNPVAALTIGPNITNITPAHNAIMIGGEYGSNILMGKDNFNAVNIGWIHSGYAVMSTFGAKPLALQPSAGNVGIGNISPGALLAVGANIPGYSPVSVPAITLGSTDHAAIVAGKDSDNGLLLAWFHPYYARLHAFGGKPLALQENGGSVGIGTTTPEEKLSVVGNIKVDQGDSNDGTFASGGLIKFGKGNTGEGIGSKRTTGSNWAGIDFYTGSSIKMSIANGGSVGIGTTSPSYKLDVNGTLRCTTLTQSSDIRLKTDIRPLSNSLDSVMKLRGVSFDWKDTSYPEGRQIGVIAQEVEAVFPELVSKDGEGYESVAYDKLVPVLIEAMKEQQEQMDAKDARISDLEQRLERLERLLTANN